MSISLLEAMSYGNAVVCSDIPENTAVCGDCAVAFKKADVDDLEKKLRLVLDDRELVKNLKSSAADYVLSRFSWQKTADRTLDLYQKVLKGEISRCKT